MVYVTYSHVRLGIIQVYVLARESQSLWRKCRLGWHPIHQLQSASTVNTKRQCRQLECNAWYITSKKLDRTQMIHIAAEIWNKTTRVPWYCNLYVIHSSQTSRWGNMSTLTGRSYIKMSSRGSNHQHIWAETIQTPLEMIRLYNLLAAPPRLQRMSRNQQYDITVKYQSETRLPNPQRTEEIYLDVVISLVEFLHNEVQHFRNETL